MYGSYFELFLLFLFLLENLVHSFYIMGWRIYLAINLLTIPVITSVVIGTVDPGPIDLDLYSGSDASTIEPDFELTNLDGLSTTLNPDILTAKNDDFTTASGECLFDSTESATQFQRRQGSSSTSGCSYNLQNDPLGEEESEIPEISPSVLISSAPKQNTQALACNDGVSPLKMEQGGGGGGDGGELFCPSTEGGEQPEAQNQEDSSVKFNAVVKFQHSPCPIEIYKYRQTPVCDSGNPNDIQRGVQDLELLRIRPPRIGMYNHRTVLIPRKLPSRLLFC